MAILAFASLLASSAAAQEVFRCTTPDGKVTYQQTPCPKASDERKVDATPANTEFDLSQREKILKQGEEAGKRLEARNAEEEAERRRRAEQRALDEKRERETQEREDARQSNVNVYPPTWGLRPPYPPPGYRPAPQPRPQPLPSTR
jgi:hypothetical protein